MTSYTFPLVVFPGKVHFPYSRQLVFLKKSEFFLSSSLYNNRKYGAIKAKNREGYSSFFFKGRQQISAQCALKMEKSALTNKYMCTGSFGVLFRIFFSKKKLIDLLIFFPKNCTFFPDF